MKTRRARAMRKREQEKLMQLVRKFVLDHGGSALDSQAPWTDDDGNSLELVLPTVCGSLRVVPYGNWIACRFSDVAAARNRLPHGPCDRLNPHSGKWNWHFAAMTAESAFATFEAEVRRLLPS